MGQGSHLTLNGAVSTMGLLPLRSEVPVLWEAIREPVAGMPNNHHSGGDDKSS